MTRYIAYVKQKDEGCDYTIGCGYRLWELKATNYDEAVEELYREILVPEPGENYFPYGPGSDRMLEAATLYEVSNVWEMPLESWFQQALSSKRVIEDARHEEYERQEYERLRRKFS